MKINIVTEPEPGWVLRWISESYAKYLPNTVVNSLPDLEADINFYINYNLFQNKTTIDVGYFTHKEKEDEILRAKFDDTAKKVDWCIAMCDETAKHLPKEKTSVNLIPPDPQFMKEKIVFGIVGTEKSSGRKGYRYIEELSKIEGVEFKITNGKYKWNEMPEFYSSIDYLLILSDNEGGPLPLVEAIAMGKPVITRDVGFANEYTCIKYRNIEDLKNIINRLVIKKDAWEKSSKELMNVFNKLNFS